MPRIHVFSDSSATTRLVTTVLRHHGEIVLHRCADAARADRLAARCVLFDMDDNAHWQSLLANGAQPAVAPVVLLTRNPVVRDIVQATLSGARDVIDLTRDAERLAGVVSAMLAAGGAGSNDARTLEALTRRQREILSLASNGLPSKLIARSLRISKRTVDAHRSRMVRRLGATSFLELVRQQIRSEVEGDRD